MRRAFVVFITTLVVATSAEAAVAASGAKYEPTLTYIGGWIQFSPEIGWAIRGIGVNSSYGVITRVSFGFGDGTTVALDPVTLKFGSSAGGSQWGAGPAYFTAIPTGATTVAADVTLINLKRPTVALDVRHVEDALDANYIGNLYCDPMLYPACP